MKLTEWQQHLNQTARYNGAIDGKWGTLTKAGTMLALTDGPHLRLSETDYAMTAARLGVQVATVKAFAYVEASGAGFDDHGLDKILPERHIFSKLTGHIFDAAVPKLSSPTWDPHWYPATQDGRYDVLMQWVGLLASYGRDIDPAFAAVSYGKFQILGSNFKACHFASAPDMAEHMARDEQTHLAAWEGFIIGNGLLPKLRAMGNSPESCIPIADAYNGTAQAQNHYADKLANARKAYGGT